MNEAFNQFSSSQRLVELIPPTPHPLELILKPSSPGQQLIIPSHLS